MIMQGKNYSEVLTEAVIDNMHFQVTWNPYESESCILWFRDNHKGLAFSALGKFSSFDKRAILDFVMRFSTNDELRRVIENKRFSQRIAKLDLTCFDQIELKSFSNREAAYRNLFCLDSSICKNELKSRWRVMAKKFHPDRGGDDRAMTIINDAYEYLTRLAN